jgi:hypothetical protein
MSIFKSVNNTNSIFSKDYQNFKSREDKNKKPSDEKDNLFGCLIKEYKKRNYSMSSLYINKNLFEPSVLLMKDSEVKNHYKLHFSDISRVNTESKYLNTVESLFNDNIGFKDELTSEGLRKQKNKNTYIDKSTEDIKKEIKFNKEKNQKLKDTLRDMNFKALVNSRTFYEKNSCKTLNDTSSKKAKCGVTDYNSWRKCSLQLEPSNTTINTKNFENSRSIQPSVQHSRINSPRRQVPTNMLKTVVNNTKKKELKFKILEASQHKYTNSNLTNYTTTTTQESQSSIDLTNRPSRKSSLRKNTIYRGENKKDVLDSLYNRLSNKGCLDDEAKEQLISYLKTFTNYFEK